MLGARTDKLLMLDWDSHALRIVHARMKRESVNILKALSVPWSSGLDRRSPQEVGTFIRRVLNEQRIRTARAVVDIPREQSVLHTLALPAGSPDELPSMVHFQIVKELPFSLDEAVVDFVVPTHPVEDEKGMVKILVAACRNEVLAFYQSVVEAAGLSLERIGLRPHANLQALPRATSEIDVGRTVFVDVGPSLTEIDVIREGQLAFSRAASVSVPVGASETSTADEPDEKRKAAVASLLVEVIRTIEAYRTSDAGASIDRAIIGGSCGVESELVAAVEQRFGFPVTLYSPPSSLDIPAEQRTGLTGFSAVLGLALGHTKERQNCFDFLHPKGPEDAQRARRRKIPLVAASLVIWLSASAVAYWQWVHPVRAEINALRTEVNQKKKWAEQFKDFQEQLEVVDAWVDNDAVWLDELDRIIEVLPAPKDAYLDRISMQDDRILLELRVTNVGMKNEFVSQLGEFRVGEESDVPRYRIEEGEFVSSSDADYKFRGRITLVLNDPDATAPSGRTGSSSRRR